MPGICEGRIVIVTGAGRGIGRGHALEFARQGAKVVVNDLGAESDGTGTSTGPAGEVVDAIRAMGGEAVANGSDIADWEGAQRMVNAAIEAFGDLDQLEKDMLSYIGRSKVTTFIVNAFASGTLSASVR